MRLFKNKKPTSTRRTSQNGGSWTILVTLVVLSVLLAAYNAYSTKHDIQMATQSPDKDQFAFFVEAADRPDILTLFKGMDPEQKLATANNIGAHNHPKLAKLAAILLQDFDVDARRALTNSLSKIAAKQPKAVAEELKNASSFQYLGVTEALKSIGDSAIPEVVKTLSNADCRPRAVEFLSNAGDVSVSPLLAQLSSDNADVRLAAVEALGKLRSRRASDPIRLMYEKAAKADRMPYLTALATIADPSQESLLVEALRDETYETPMKAQAALGLGRIASPTSVRVLWERSNDVDPDLVDAAVAGLQLAGDSAFRFGTGSPSVVLDVCLGVESSVSNDIIAKYLDSPNPVLVQKALSASRGRSVLVPKLAAILARVDGAKDGRVAEQVVQALSGSDQGRKVLDTFRGDPLVEGFVQRQKLMGSFTGT